MIPSNDAVTTASRKPQTLAILPYAPNRIRIRTTEALRVLAAVSEVDVICLDDGMPAEFPDGIRDVCMVNNASKLSRAIRVGLGVLRKRPVTHEFIILIDCEGSFAEPMWANMIVSM